MKHEQLISHAIALAGAFIANGDIRLSGDTRDNSTAMAMTRDLISTLYAELAKIDAGLSPGLSH